MIYICENCGFLFSRMGEVKECPSCEKNQIRLATEEDTDRIKDAGVLAAVRMFNNNR